MTQNIWIGFALALAAGVTSGTCMLPMRLARHWRWENVWLVFSVVALLIAPWTLAFLTIPDLISTYFSLDQDQFVLPVLLGSGWGLAQVLFGLAIGRLGLALGYAIVMGFVSVLGTLVPLAANERALSEISSLVFWGVAAMLLGIAVSGWAGWLRNLECRATSPRDRPAAYGPALALAIACGLLSPMLNYAFAFSDRIRSAALQHGASPATAGYAVWPIVLSAGFLPNVAYSVYLLHKNGTATLFNLRSRDAMLAVAMGVLWMGSLAMYGWSAAYLGDLGTSVGWGIVQALALITATVLGSVTHEWTDAGQAAFRLRVAGLALLIVATFLMATGAA